MCVHPDMIYTRLSLTLINLESRLFKFRVQNVTFTFLPTGGNSSLPLSVHGGHMETACAEHKKCSSTVFEHIAISLLKLCHSYPPVKHFELTCD